jgi:phosphate uptake regulator
VANPASTGPATRIYARGKRNMRAGRIPIDHIVDVMSSPESEVRKLQETGRASFIVSVPKKWVQDLGLGKGSLIQVTRQQDGSLAMTAGQQSKQRPSETTVVVEPDEDPDSLARKIIALYLTSLNTIVLKSKGSRMTPRIRDVVRELVRKKLVGTEIVSESSTETVLQVLLSYPELSAENALRRMITIADQMHKDAVVALCEGKHDLAVQVLKSDDEVDRFGFYVVRLMKQAVEDPRLLSEVGLKSPRDCLGYRLIAKSVERIGDHAVKIAEQASELQEALTPKLAARVKEFSEFCSLQFQEASQALFRGDYSMADRVLARQDSAEKLEVEIEKQIYRQNLPPESISGLILILESLKRTGEYGTDIAEIVLNMTVGKLNI